MRGACRTKEGDNHATSSISTNHDYPTIETNKSKNFVFWQHSEGRKTHSSPLPLNRAHFCFFLFSALPSLPLSRRGGGRNPQVVRSVAGNKEVTHQTKKLSHSAHVCAFSHTFCCCCHFLFVSFFFFFLPLFGLDEATGKLKSRHTHTHTGKDVLLLASLLYSSHYINPRTPKGTFVAGCLCLLRLWTCVGIHIQTHSLRNIYTHTYVLDEEEEEKEMKGRKERWRCRGGRSGLEASTAG